MPLSQALVGWADEIICAEYYHQGEVMKVMDNVYLAEEARPLVRVLEVPDDYDYMDGELQRLIRAKFDE